MLIAILSDVMRETDEHGSAIELMQRPATTPTCDEAPALGRKRQSPGLARSSDAASALANELEEILSGVFEPPALFSRLTAPMIARSARKRCDLFRSTVTAYSSDPKP